MTKETIEKEKWKDCKLLVRPCFVGDNYPSSLSKRVMNERSATRSKLEAEGFIFLGWETERFVNPERMFSPGNIHADYYLDKGSPKPGSEDEAREILAYLKTLIKPLDL